MNNRYAKNSYLSAPRLYAYIEQYRYVNEGDNILEIGKGAGIFGDIARRTANYSSMDIDPRTEPDIVANVSNWNSMEDLAGKYTVIFCCQVLEHMPFCQAVEAFQNILRLGARMVVLSLPDRRFAIKICVRLHALSLRKVISIPWSGRDVNITNNSEHHWEICKGNSSEVQHIFRNPAFDYKLILEYRFYERTKQHFYIYEKKTS